VKKLVAGFFVGFVASNFLGAYSDGLFARAGTLLTNENEKVTKSMSAVEIMKYLLDGAQIEEAAIPGVIREMREAGYTDFAIADHLRLDVRAVRLVVPR